MDRNWAGDTEGRLVTYRAIAGDVKYIWPLSTPISDGDTQRKRVNRLRKSLQWKLIGCELIECYEGVV